MCYTYRYRRTGEGIFVAKKTIGISEKEVRIRLGLTPKLLRTAQSINLLTKHENGKYVEEKVRQALEDYPTFVNVLSGEVLLNATESAQMLGVSVPVFKKAVEGSDLTYADKGSWQYGTVYYYRTVDVENLRLWLYDHYNNKGKMVEKIKRAAQKPRPMLDIASDTDTPIVSSSQSNLQSHRELLEQLINELGGSQPVRDVMLAVAFETIYPQDHTLQSCSQHYRDTVKSLKSKGVVAEYILIINKAKLKKDVVPVYREKLRSVAQERLEKELVNVMFLSKRLQIRGNILVSRLKDDLVDRAKVENFLEKNYEWIVKVREGSTIVNRIDSVAQEKNRRKKEEEKRIKLEKAKIQAERVRQRNIAKNKIKAEQNKRIAEEHQRKLKLYEVTSPYRQQCLARLLECEEKFLSHSQVAYIFGMSEEEVVSLQPKSKRWAQEYVRNTIIHNIDRIPEKYYISLVEEETNADKAEADRVVEQLFSGQEPVPPNIISDDLSSYEKAIRTANIVFPNTVKKTEIFND